MKLQSQLSWGWHLLTKLWRILTMEFSYCYISRSSMKICILLLKDWWWGQGHARIGHPLWWWWQEFMNIWMSHGVEISKWWWFCWASWCHRNHSQLLAEFQPNSILVLHLWWGQVEEFEAILWWSVNHSEYHPKGKFNSSGKSGTKEGQFY